MDKHPPSTLEHSLTAALDWWREAGVDLDFGDEPQNWLAERQPETVKAAAEPDAVALSTAPQTMAAPRELIGGDRANWPTSLATFREWWLSEPSLASGDPALRIPPEGTAQARLMVLVPMPAEGAESLSASREGRLVRSFARAAGIGEDELYLASALPRHMAMPDWDSLAQSGLGEILQLHCRLAAPRRLLVLGNKLSPLVGPEIPFLASYAPERLLEHARLRAGLWQKWLDWTGGAAQGMGADAVEND